MCHKDFATHSGCQWEMAKYLEKEGEHLVIVLRANFTLESINAVHVLGLVVAPSEIDACWVMNFKKEEGKNYLYGKGTSIYKISC